VLGVVQALGLELLFVELLGLVALEQVQARLSQRRVLLAEDLHNNSIFAAASHAQKAFSLICHRLD